MSNPQYAPNPKKQAVYNNLQNKKLGDVTAKDIQQLTDPTFIQATNQDALITYNMLNKAAMRDGNIMPNTGGIETITQTSGSVYATFRPPLGEVWKVMGISAYNTVAPTGTNVYNTFLSDATTAAISDEPSGEYDNWYSSVSSSSTHLLTESLFEEVFQPFFITNSMFLRIGSTMVNIGTGGNVKFHMAYMRIR